MSGLCALSIFSFLFSSSARFGRIGWLVMARVTEVPGRTPYDSFKPAEHANDIAFIIVPREIKRGVATQFGEKDFVHFDAYAFESMGDIEAATPREYFNCSLPNVALIQTMEDSVGMVMGPYRFIQKPSKKGNPAWVFEALSPSDAGFAVADAFAEKLDAKLNAPAPAAPLLS